MRLSYDLVITFPANVATISFEKILKSNYRKSQFNANSSICFDFEKVEFCGIFELSMISLWILKLLSKGKNLFFNVPTSNKVYKFLNNYEFFHFLKENSISSNGDKYKKRYHPVIAPMFPLTFHDNSFFRSLLKDLNDPKRLNYILKDIADADIVKSNAIHTVILKEISDNVFVHTACKSANMILTKMTVPKINNINTGFAKSLSDYDFNFFRNIENAKCICLVISDDGPGFFKKLAKAYIEDEILPTNLKKEKPSEIDIIKYAFLKHSTSRSDIDRKSAPPNFLESSTLFQYPLPTGLFEVFNTVKRYKGLMYVRSGKSVVSYDFLSSPDKVVIKTSEDIKKVKPLTEFPGVQFKFIFPIETKTKFSFIKYKDNYLFNTKNKVKLNYISINDFFDETYNFESEKDQKKIEDIIKSLTTLYIEMEDMRSSIVLNCSDFQKINYKNIIHYIVASLMDLQNDKITNILFDIDNKKVSELKNIFSDNFFSNLKPIFVIDKRFDIDVVGIEECDLDLIQQGFAGKLSKTKIEELLEKYKGILTCEGEKLLYDIPQKKIIKYIFETIERRLKASMLNREKNIFHSAAKVLLPNKYYCQGFFEIFKIFDYENITNDLLLYLSIQFYKIRPDVIITLGENCKKLLDDGFNKNILFISKEGLRRYHITTASIYAESYRISRQIDNDEIVLILTDVIGSSETLKNCIRVLRKKPITKIISIINTNHEIENYIDIDLLRYDVDSIVNNPLHFYPELPKSWNYNEVKIIDTFFNRIIENKTLPEGPLWIGVERKEVFDQDEPFEILINDFLENIVGTSNSFFNGHFISRHNHLTCLFNIPILIENFSNDISNIIIDYINQQLERINLSTDNQISYKIKHILYPDFNPGLDQIAFSIVKKIEDAHAISVNEAHFKTGLDPKYSFKNEAVAILDDAFISGGTIKRLIDICEDRNAKHIFVFVLIKRGNYFQAKEYEKLKQYGRSSIHARYLVDTEMPIFRKDNCPICYTISILNDLQKLFKNNESCNELFSILENKIANLRGKKVSTIFIEEKYLKEAKEDIYKDISKIDMDIQERDRFTYVNFRWKLEQAIKAENINMRKDISTLLTQFNSHPERSLLVLQVLSTEKSYFLLNQKNRNALLYSKIENNIINACKYFLNNLHLIDEEQLYDVLNVFLEFDENYFPENFCKILINCQKNKNDLFIILIMSFISKAFKENPIQVTIMLEKIKNKFKDEIIFRNITAVSEIYENLHKNNQLSKSIKAERHSELRVMLHKIRQRTDALNFYLDINNYDKEALINSWGILKNVLDDFQNKLNLFMNSLVSKNMYRRFNEVATKLSIPLSEMTNLFKVCNFDERSLKEMQMYLSRIEDYLVEPNVEDGFISLFDRLRINLQDVCYDILEQEKDRLNRKGFVYDYEFPDTPCMVFGEEDHIIEIVKNLIENVHKHSNGNKMLLKGIIDYSERTIHLFVLDNGRIENDIIYLVGLKNVDRSANICGGTFNICDIKTFKSLSTKEVCLEGFNEKNTVAKISLPLLQTRR